MQPRKQESLPGQKKFNFFHFSCHIFDFLTFILIEHVKGKRILSGRAGARRRIYAENGVGRRLFVSGITGSYDMINKFAGAVPGSTPHETGIRVFDQIERRWGPDRQRMEEEYI